jgi:copper chaperone CopZ
MIAFTVHDMYSSRSAGTIIKSVKAVDQGAVVRVNLMNHQVEIEPCRAEARELSEAIGRVGFTPVAVQIPLPFDDDMPDSGTSSASIQYPGVVDVLLPSEAGDTAPV